MSPRAVFTWEDVTMFGIDEVARHKDGWRVTTHVIRGKGYELWGIHSINRRLVRTLLFHIRVIRALRNPAAR